MSLPDLKIDKIFKNDEFVIVKKSKTVKKRDRRNTTWVDKYRPRTLKDIVGHDDVKNMLLTSIEKGDLLWLLTN